MLLVASTTVMCRALVARCHFKLAQVREVLIDY